MFGIFPDSGEMTSGATHPTKLLALRMTDAGSSLGIRERSAMLMYYTMAMEYWWSPISTDHFLSNTISKLSSSLYVIISAKCLKNKASTNEFPFPCSFQLLSLLTKFHIRKIPNTNTEQETKKVTPKVRNAALFSWSLPWEDIKAQARMWRTGPHVVT